MRVRATSLLWLSCSLELTILFHLLSLVCAARVSVDDNDGALSYSPSDTWGQGSGCSSCALRPDSSQTFDGTWHDTTYHAGGVACTITFKFTGVGVSAIFVVPDKTQLDVTVDTNLIFTLDGSQAGTYTHSPSGGADFLYNQTLFEKSGLSNDDHTLVVTAVAPDGQSSVVLFDYFIYATDDGTTSSGATFTSTSTSSSSSSSSSNSAAGSSPSSSGSSSGTSTGNPSSNTAGLSSGSSSSTPTSGASSFSASSSSSSSGSLSSGTISTAAASASSNTDVPVPTDSKTNVGAIAGGVIGGVLGLLLALLLVFFCRKKARRVREVKKETFTIPAITSTRKDGMTESAGSLLGFERGEEVMLTSHPVTFSDQARRTVTNGKTCIQSTNPSENFTSPTTREKSQPVVSRSAAFPVTSVPSFVAEGERQPSGTDDGQSSNADAHSHRLSSTVNAAEILNQVTAIRAAVLSLQDQRMNGQTVGVDGTVPPPYST